MAHDKIEHYLNETTFFLINTFLSSTWQGEPSRNKHGREKPYGPNHSSSDHMHVAPIFPSAVFWALLQFILLANLNCLRLVFTHAGLSWVGPSRAGATRAPPPATIPKHSQGSKHAPDQNNDTNMIRTKVPKAMVKHK